VVDKRVVGVVLIGHEIVAKATPDGNTLILGAAGPLTVALIAATPFVLVVNPSVLSSMKTPYTLDQSLTC
jgi:hypothetical protein